jgi:hypothetical protein
MIGFFVGLKFMIHNHIYYALALSSNVDSGSGSLNLENWSMPKAVVRF